MFNKRLGRRTLLGGCIVTAAIICMVSATATPDLPEVRLIRLFPTKPTNRPTSKYIKYENELTDPWTAQIEISIRPASLLILPESEIPFELYAADGQVLKSGTYIRPRELGFGWFLPEARAKNLNPELSIPERTRRIRLKVRVRAFTLRERCRNTLFKTGMLTQLPGVSNLILRCLPGSENWQDFIRSGFKIHLL